MHSVQGSTLYYNEKCMKKILVPFMLLFLACCQEHHDENSIEIDFDNAPYIAFEEAIDSFYIKPVYSDYPLS